ncbi:hypothetical protein C5E16_01800 [Clavibacter michiganensis]|uniref:Uncharacterized protein n=1 Tax=Clavibacter michiganensis TaxID=28447 RepID=A0A2S5VXK0_9MICO|nr:hypothetical protein [Clavibacter michiganensis]PPF71007.1 hypothetical protein C5E16_01800 [Clavibacter michiganensis]
MQTTDDVERGAWLTQRMEQGTGSVSETTGTGFDAYVRILHPVPSPDSRREPTHDGSWSTRRWADVATRNGRRMHRLVQWGRLLGLDDPDKDGTSDVGWLDPGLLAALAPILEEATTTPDDLFAGFWEGGNGQDLPRRRVLDGPWRSYVLARTDIDELTATRWAAAMDPDHIDGLGTISLELLWPEDHAWALGAEIDFDSTVIGGSRALIDAILADRRFEAYEVAEDDDLTWDSDTVNRPAPANLERN